MPPETDEEQVWRQMNRVYTAFRAGDPDAVDALMDPEVTIWDSAESELVRGLTGLAALRARRPGPAEPDVPTVVDIQAADPVVTVWGDTALLRHHLRVVFAEDRPDQIIRNTSVWRRSGGRWRAVHNHEDVVSG